MTDPARDDALDPVWAERYEADIAEDTRGERRLMVRALAIALAVAALTVARWVLA